MPFTFITAAEKKRLLRAQVKQTLSALTQEQRLAGDEAMFERFLSLPQVERAETILMFWGIGQEPEVQRLFPRLLERGKRLALPRCLPEHGMEARLYSPDVPLVRHRFGMAEPSDRSPLVSQEEINLALVPAVCYDRSRRRLGRGGGYYDRWLEGFGGFTVGLCRACVLQERLPTQEWDRMVDMVITERDIIK